MLRKGNKEMNDVTVRAGWDEQLETRLSTFDPDKDRWCSVYISSSQGNTILRFESHVNSLHLLDELRGRLEEVSRYLRGGKV
jgi:hypothetical protein